MEEFLEEDTLDLAQEVHVLITAIEEALVPLLKLNESGQSLKLKRVVALLEKALEDVR